MEESGATFQSWPTPQAPPAGPPDLPVAADPDFSHFLRYLGVFLAVAITTQLFLAGLVWMLIILDRTGHRKRDYLTVVLPHRAIWRYTARSVYWQPRHDRQGDILRSWQRPVAIIAGYALPVLVVGLLVVALSVGDDGWTTFERETFTASLTRSGNIDDDTAHCIVDHLVSAFPDGPPDVDHPRFRVVVQDAVQAC